MASEWEEITFMMEVGNSAHIDNRRPGESYFQILGLSSERPMVKVNNQLYTGQFTDTIGSHLFLEVENEAGDSASQSENKVIKEVLVSDKYLKLEPVYLEQKKETDSLPRDQPQQSGSNKT